MFGLLLRQNKIFAGVTLGNFIIIFVIIYFYKLNNRLFYQVNNQKSK